MSEQADLEKTFVQLNNFLEKFKDSDDYIQSKPIDYDKVQNEFMNEFDDLIRKPCHHKFSTEAEKLYIILKYVKTDEKSLLIRAMSLPLRENSKADKARDAIVVHMIQRCPYLILQDCRYGGYEGLTALHLAILQDKMVNTFHGSITHEMLKAIKTEISRVGNGNAELSFHGKIVTGEKLMGTRMSAGTLLGVAALSGNKAVFNELTSYVPNITETNSTNRDNVLHSLIKHSRTNDDKKHKMKQLNMIRHVLRKAKEKAETLLLEKNLDSLTPLKLAAEQEEFEIFEFLMNHRMYRHVNSNDGLMDLSEYDITDIVADPIPKDDKEEFPLKSKLSAKSDIFGERDVCRSVLSFIGNLHSPNTACKFVGLTPVRKVIFMKWKKYQFAFYAWACIHTFSMISVMVGGHFRQVSDKNQTEFHPQPLFSYWLVVISAVVQLMNGLVYVLLLIYMLVLLCKDGCEKRYGRNTVVNMLSHPYSNAQFTILFPLFGVCLFLDFILALIDVKDYDNVLLPFAIMIGCYLCLYFLQVITIFSVFTVLIQKIVPDLLRFLFVMSILLVGFSMAMFMVMQGADTDDDSFDNYRTTLMTMLQVMLGIGEISSLFSARKPLAAILVFVIFVIFTTILLLNALIAIMSNNCGTITSPSVEFNNNDHYLLQRLSVILQIEDYIPNSCIRSVGEWSKNKKRLLLKYEIKESNANDHKYSPTRPSKKKTPKTAVEPRNEPTNGTVDFSLRVSKTEDAMVEDNDLEKMQTITFERA